MKRFIMFILCVAMLMGFIGCGSTREGTVDSGSESSAEAQPLKVYYINAGHSGKIAESLLDWYKQQDDALKIEATAFPSGEELEKALEEGQPDIIILDMYTGGPTVNPYEWAKADYLLGVNQYLEEDADFKEENYIGGVMRAGRYEEEQYILPLSVCGQYVFSNSEKFETGALTDLSAGFTTSMMLDILIGDANLHEGDSEYFSQAPFIFSIASSSQWLYDCLEQTGALHIDREKKMVTVDEALFQKTMEYFKVTYQSAMPFLTGEINLMTMSLSDLNDAYTAAFGNANMICAARYLSSAYHQQVGQDAVMIPLQREEGGYALNINVMGMVGAESSQPQKAYECLRSMMDISYKRWETINMSDALADLCPVNKGEALAMIDSYETISGGKYKILKDTIDREKLPQDLAEQLRNVINETQATYIVDADVCEVLSTYLADYYTGQSDTLDVTGEEIKKAIEDVL